MAVRNSHSRQDSLDTRLTVDGKRYAIYSADVTVDRNKRQYVANKLKQGKVEVPKEAQVYYETTILYATSDNKLVANSL